MTFQEIALYDKIRRLSNSSNPACNPYFPAEWKVYWKDFWLWREYEEVSGSKSVRILLAFEPNWALRQNQLKMVEAFPNTVVKSDIKLHSQLRSTL